VYNGTNLIFRFILKYFLWSSKLLPDRDFYSAFFLTAYQHRLIGPNTDFEISHFQDARYKKIYSIIQKLILSPRIQGIKIIQQPKLLGNMVILSLMAGGYRYDVGFQLNEDTKNYYIKGKLLSVYIIGCKRIENPVLVVFIKSLLNKIEDMLNL